MRARAAMPPAERERAVDAGRAAEAGAPSPGATRPDDPARESLAAFLAALAGAAPAPGGGAAAALSGALAAALLAMVCRVTAAREPAAASLVGPSLARADELRQRLERLVGEDMEAYRGVLEARRSARGAVALQDALARATAVPLALAGACREVLDECERVAGRARASTLADLGVGAALAWGALESGALIARANLGEMADADAARASEAELAGAIAQAREASRRAADTIARRTTGRS